MRSIAPIYLGKTVYTQTHAKIIKSDIRNAARALSMYLPYLSIQSIDNTFYHTQCVVFSHAENAHPNAYH